MQYIEIKRKENDDARVSCLSRQDITIEETLTM